jgi:hypothetical protein
MLSAHFLEALCAPHNSSLKHLSFLSTLSHSGAHVGADELWRGMLHTPPQFTPGSYELSHMKRARAGSISGRLRR